ncbi:phage major capsid protein [Trueperella bernardiae]|uniref:phage major capsid protein n=1 Tax=Trueperella bernardiae TaxID=59561 RepID=UPI002889D24E|nr:phage major capsid protein [Trueperella bernardiae]
MSLKTERAALAEKAAAYKARIKAGETLTDEEVNAVKGLISDIDALDAKIADASEKASVLDRLGALEDGSTSASSTDDETSAKSIGEHFVKSAKAAGVVLAEKRPFFAPEFKANTDLSLIGGPEGGYGPYITDIDRAAVFPASRPLTIADLMAAGTLSGSSIRYPIYGAVEGNAATVAEGGAKPQVHFPAPSWVTESLAEIAAWTGISDTMAEDAPYLQTQINQQLIRLLQIAEEDQILSGDGEGSNLKGLLNRDGILSLEATADDLADKIATAQTNILTATGSMWRADGVVINPQDYNELRLKRDSNGQYYAGGPFTGAYGNGQTPSDPPLWNMPTVQTTAVPKGTLLVGAFKSAVIFRKNGLQLASSDSHADYFTKDLIAIRAKTRAALEVKWPGAFCKIKIGG